VCIISGSPHLISTDPKISLKSTEFTVCLQYAPAESASRNWPGERPPNRQLQLQPVPAVQGSSRHLGPSEPGEEELSEVESTYKMDDFRINRLTIKRFCAENESFMNRDVVALQARNPLKYLLEYHLSGHSLQAWNWPRQKLHIN
jgi:hypothetical protein